MNSKVAQATNTIKTTECFRDAIQGLPQFIPTKAKARCLNALLRVGFDFIDCGSFVSSKAIPQMQDTSEVLQLLDMSKTRSKLSVVVCNLKGAQLAVKEEKVSLLGYPISLSDVFQKRNTNRSIEDAFAQYKEIHEFVKPHKQVLFPYLSMCFGNPYNEPFSIASVLEFIERLSHLGARSISLADTSGVGTPDIIFNVFSEARTKFPDIAFRAHLHTTLETVSPNLNAARNAGCSQIETALGGLGGCPFAASSLMGNAPTEVLFWLIKQGSHSHGIDQDLLTEAKHVQNEVIGVTIKDLILHSDASPTVFEAMCRKCFNLGDTPFLERQAAEHHFTEFTCLWKIAGSLPTFSLPSLNTISVSAFSAAIQSVSNKMFKNILYN